MFNLCFSSIPSLFYIVLNDDYMLCKVTLGVLKGASKLNVLLLLLSLYHTDVTSENFRQKMGTVFQRGGPSDRHSFYSLPFTLFFNAGDNQIDIHVNPSPSDIDE